MLFDQVGETVLRHGVDLHCRMDRLECGGQPTQRHLREQQGRRDAQAAPRGRQAVATLFLINAVVADEYNQALIALNVAREAGIERIVYLSVIHSDRYVNVPHFAGKYGVERMIERMGVNATILRPAYFIGNHATIRDVVTGHGIYPMPIDGKGLAMVDMRDVDEVAAIERLRRERSAVPLPLERINQVGPDTLTGPKVAAIWTARSPIRASTPPHSSATRGSLCRVGWPLTCA